MLIALTAISSAMPTSPVAADPIDGGTGGYSGGSAGGQEGRVVVVVPGGSSPGWPASGYRGGGWGQTAPANIECQFLSAPVPISSPVPGMGPQITDTSTIEKGTFIWLICRDATSGDITFQNLFPWDPADPVALAPPAPALAQMAANSVRLPVAAARSWPPAGGTGLVNLPVWLRVDNWAPLSAAASAGGLTAVVEARPERVEWDMDEDRKTCTNAGSVYDTTAAPDPVSSSCSYTYRRSSGVKSDLSYHNSATVFWRLRWTATNGQGGDLGELAGPTASFTLQIEESQALVAATPR